MGRPKVRTEQTRRDLVAAAFELLGTDGPASLSARRVAGAAGTSTGALYELFGDKAGLVRALFSETLVRLDQAQDSVAETGDARADLVAQLAATRRFALDNPMLYELLRGRPFAGFDPSEVDTEVGRRLYRRGVRAVEGYLVEVAATVRPAIAADVVVAAHHGLVSSELSGILGRTAASREEKYRLGVRMILDGLAPTRSRSDVGHGAGDSDGVAR